MVASLIQLSGRIEVIVGFVRTHNNELELTGEYQAVCTNNDEQHYALALNSSCKYTPAQKASSAKSLLGLNKW